MGARWQTLSVSIASDQVTVPAASLVPKARPRRFTSADVLERARTFPRLRYMGSKYQLLPHLERTFAEAGGTTALDAFSGSGVVSYLLKAQGFSVTSNDFMAFSATVARATVENSTERLSLDVVEQICGPAADDRDFIQRTFSGRFFTEEDLRFLDSAWSHIDNLRGYQRDIALSALILSAARKQPRGVFTFTGTRYTDGRRDLRISLREHFRERVAEYNATVFDVGTSSRAVCGDIFDFEGPVPDLVYLDPPYAPPRDDADYMKRYHFLEGLSVYWRNVEIMTETKTQKIAKRFTPFAYKRSIEDALSRTFEKFAGAPTIVLSYSSNALPSADRIVELMGNSGRRVDVQAIEHRYSFGTHSTAVRRGVSEYLFVGRS